MVSSQPEGLLSTQDLKQQYVVFLLFVKECIVGSYFFIAYTDSFWWSNGHVKKW